MFSKVIKQSFLFYLICCILLLGNITTKAITISQDYNLQNVQLLEQGSLISKEIGKEKKHVYKLSMRKNTFAFIEIVQKNIPININIYKDNKLINTINSERLFRGFEPIYLFSEQLDTTFFITVDVNVHEKAPSTGIYSIQLIELRSISDDDRKKTEMTANISKITNLLQGSKKNLEDAINKCEDTLEICRELKLRKAQIVIYRHMGYANQISAKYEEALNFYNKALSLTDDGTSYQGQIFGLIGEVYNILGDYQKSLNYFEQALKLNDATFDSVGKSDTLDVIGENYISLGEFDKALNCLQDALRLNERMNDFYGMAVSCNNIGVAYGFLNNSDKALEYMEKAVSLAEKVKAIGDKGIYLSNIGAAYKLAKKYDKSIESYKEALAIQHTRGETEAEAITLSNLGILHVRLKNYDEAMNLYKKSLDLHQSLKLQQHVAITLERISECQKLSGKLLDSKKSIEDAILILESLRTNILVQDLRSSYLSVENRYYKRYIDILMQLHDENPKFGYDIMALEANEKALGRNILEVLIEGNIDISSMVQVDRNLLDEQKAIKVEIDQKAEQLLKANQQNTKKLEQEVGELESRLQLLESKIKSLNPNYSSLVYPKPLTVKKIQENLLDQNSILVEYSLGVEDFAYIWVISKNAVVSLRIREAKTINKLSEDVYNNISNFFAEARFEKNSDKVAKLLEKKRNETNELISSLSQLIIEPISNYLPENKKLLIVADGGLYRVPFSVLLKQKNNVEGKHCLLVEQHEIVNIFSASSLYGQRELLKTNTNGQVVLIGDPIFSSSDERVTSSFSNKNVNSPLNKNKIEEAIAESGINRGDFLARLYFTRQEISKISEFIPNNKVTILLDFDANINFFSSNILKNAQIIHLATHGLLNKSTKLTGVVLSLVDREGKEIDGFLSAQRVFSSKLNAELVVLSACQTALGKEVKGEGLIGIGRAFTNAGAKRLLLTLWKIDDEATSEFMSKFYEKLLKEKLPVSSALRLAQLYMLKSSKWDLPYYWAAFVIQGEPN